MTEITKIKIESAIGGVNWLLDNPNALTTEDVLREIRAELNAALEGEK